VGGDGLAENLRIGEDAGAVRVETGEHGVAAGAAEGEGAVGALKLHSPRGEFVDVRGFGAGVTVASKVVVQVIGDDEQHVGLFGR
jgi:hypothetical protein